MHLRFRQHCAPDLLLSGLALLGTLSLDAAEKMQFNRDIRPILSDRCFKCHGPDKAARKASLRLDVAEEAYAERKKAHQHAIVPGKPEESLACRKIFSSEMFNAKAQRSKEFTRINPARQSRNQNR